MFSRAGRNLFCSLAPFNAYPQAFQTQAPRYFTAAVSSISSQVDGIPVKIFNENGSKRVVVTKDLPGKRWLDVLVNADCRVEVCTHPDAILDVAKVKTLISTRCDGVIGQLTEDWSEELFGALKSAGGTAFSTYAVGYNNVKVAAANAHGLPVGNTPGVLTETTAEIAAALTLAAARRVAEADVFMRSGQYVGWLPALFVGNLLQRKTVGIIGAGRIGQAYARMMIEGHKMDCIYYDMFPQPKFEEYVTDYGKFLEGHDEEAVTIRRADTVENLLREADVVSLHCLLDASTTHLMNAERLGMMKSNAVLVNSARGPVIDEVALPGLAECANAVILPHIASASLWTRGGMATLAASNVAGVLQGFPLLPDGGDVLKFVDGPLGSEELNYTPSIVNSADVPSWVK
ncbi:hypothetical protein CYMTET_10438 [Cymbomonas tetramitiformis]|uniref:Glycerate dehydrogenase n=1 Tax=Cymbomonas tetramitiformis TaxID=36881 RepID=A0AAE0LE66_9CHLO|nr:hypothetical protein CYMTET_10438 [Cymbomonas tetramitiformis]